MYAITIPPLILVLCLLYFVRSCRKHSLHHIPAVGPSSFPLSYVGAIEFLINANELLQRGRRQYATSAFKVAQLSSWIVVITGSQLIEELKKATEDDLPYNDVALEGPLKYTGISVKRNELTLMCIQHARNLSLIFSDMRNEVVVAISDMISKDPASEWIAVSVVNMTEIVSRVYNRGPVGLQGCRDPALIVVNQRFLLAKTYATAAFFKPLQLLVFHILNRTRRSIRKVHDLLVPIIEERRRGTLSPTKEDPHDLFSFLTLESESSLEITRRIVTLNYQAVLPTTLTLVDALHHLALASPREVVEHMREEVGKVIGKYGWTSKALEHMHKVDSFLKESMRVNDLYALTAHRKTRTSYTFHDGTYLPAGTLLSLATTPTHMNPTRYASPETFDAFRFARDNGLRHELATTTPDFLAWGYGRTTCPGRFAAAAMMKLIFAHMVLHYDVKLKDTAMQKPKVRWFGTERLLNVKADILLRRRK